MKTLNYSIIFAAIFILLFFILALIGLGEARTPLVLSGVFAYIFFPLIKKMEKVNINRNIALLLFFLIVVVLIFCFAILIVPFLIKELKELLTEMPRYVGNLFLLLDTFLVKLNLDVDFSKEGVLQYAQEHTSQIAKHLFNYFSLGVKSSYQGLSEIIGNVLSIFLFPLFFTYVVNDYEKISNNLSQNIPSNILPTIKNYQQHVNSIFKGYFRGQLLVALILALLYSISLGLIGVKFGFIIGVITGLLSIIPYVGVFFGIFAVSIGTIAHFTGITQIALIILVFGSIQVIEGFILTPKLVGNKVGLSELSTFVALIIAGNFLGLTGMFIAIPAAALLLMIFKDVYQYTLESFEK